MDENSLFDRYLRMIDYTFRWSGLHLNNRKNYNVNKARILYCIHFIALNLNVAGGFWWFAKQAAKGDSLISLTYAAPSIALACLCNCKSISIMLNHDYVDKLVFKLRELESKVDLNSIDNKSLIEEPIKFLHFVLKVSNLFNWILIVSFPSMPLARTAYNFLAFNKVELEFPFLTEYPFNPYDIKIYPFVLLSHIWGGKYLGYTFLKLFCALIFCSCFSHRLLSFVNKPVQTVCGCTSCYTLVVLPWLLHCLRNSKKLYCFLCYIRKISDPCCN